MRSHSPTGHSTAAAALACLFLQAKGPPLHRLCSLRSQVPLRLCWWCHRLWTQVIQLHRVTLRNLILSRHYPLQISGGRASTAGFATAAAARLARSHTMAQGQPLHHPPQLLRLVCEPEDIVAWSFASHQQRRRCLTSRNAKEAATTLKVGAFPTSPARCDHHHTTCNKHKRKTVCPRAKMASANFIATHGVCTQPPPFFFECLASPEAS